MMFVYASMRVWLMAGGQRLKVMMFGYAIMTDGWSMEDGSDVCET